MHKWIQKENDNYACVFIWIEYIDARARATLTEFEIVWSLINFNRLWLVELNEGCFSFSATLRWFRFLEQRIGRHVQFGIGDIVDFFWSSSAWFRFCTLKVFRGKIKLNSNCNFKTLSSIQNYQFHFCCLCSSYRLETFYCQLDCWLPFVEQFQLRFHQFQSPHYYYSRSFVLVGIFLIIQWSNRHYSARLDFLFGDWWVGWHCNWLLAVLRVCCRKLDPVENCRQRLVVKNRENHVLSERWKAEIAMMNAIVLAVSVELYPNSMLML